jgi:hypothetical protein
MKVGSSLWIGAPSYVQFTALWMVRDAGVVEAARGELSRSGLHHRNWIRDPKQLLRMIQRRVSR